MGPLIFLMLLFNRQAIHARVGGLNPAERAGLGKKFTPYKCPTANITRIEWHLGLVPALSPSRNTLPRTAAWCLT